MLLVDQVAEFLKDGRWHNLQTLALRLDQPEEKVREVVRFLSEFTIIVYGESAGQVKIVERFGQLFH